MGTGSVVRGGSPRLHRSVLGMSLVAAFVMAGCATGTARQPRPRTDYRTAAQLETTASQAADTTDWEHMHPARVEDLIAGRFAGVEVVRLPNGSSAIHVRGINTFIGNTEPLFVIDGMEVAPGPGGALLGLNPADVARIEVLKDAGATALYGIRGANGVILITTKRAR